MTELAMLQNKFNAMEKKTDKEFQRILHAGVVLENNGGNPKSVAAYLQMAIDFFGKWRVESALERPEYDVLKKYMRR